MVRKTIADLRRGECNACLFMGAVIFASVVYWTIAPFVDPIVLNDLLDGPLMVVSFVTGGYYLTWALFNCHKVVDRAWVIRFGICMAWVGNGVWRVSRFLYSRGVIHGTIGEHDKLRGYMILIMVMAGVLHILAIDMNGSRPKIDKVAVAIASILVGAAAVVVARGGA